MFDDKVGMCRSCYHRCPAIAIQGPKKGECAVAVGGGVLNVKRLRAQAIASWNRAGRFVTGHARQESGQEYFVYFNWSRRLA